MARYRRYKNGIIGHRYKNYFIVKGYVNGKTEFSILSEDKTILEKNILNYEDAEWAIDKITASPCTIEILKDLYNEQLYMLSQISDDLMRKDNDEGLNINEQEFFNWVKKIRSRKAKGKPY